MKKPKNFQAVIDACTRNCWHIERLIKEVINHIRAGKNLGKFLCDCIEAKEYIEWRYRMSKTLLKMEEYIHIDDLEEEIAL